MEVCWPSVDWQMLHKSLNSCFSSTSHPHLFIYRWWLSSYPSILHLLAFYHNTTNMTFKPASIHWPIFIIRVGKSRYTNVLLEDFGIIWRHRHGRNQNASMYTYIWQLGLDILHSLIWLSSINRFRYMTIGCYLAEANPTNPVLKYAGDNLGGKRIFYNNSCDVSGAVLCPVRREIVSIKQSSRIFVKKTNNHVIYLLTVQKYIWQFNIKSFFDWTLLCIIILWNFIQLLVKLIKSCL